VENKIKLKKGFDTTESLATYMSKGNMTDIPTALTAQVKDM
jgi:hypothetical protein